MLGLVRVLRRHQEFDVTGNGREKYLPMEQLTQITRKSWLDGVMIIWNASTRQESGP